MLFSWKFDLLSIRCHEILNIHHVGGSYRLWNKKKILQENDHTMIRSTFWSTETNFRSISTCESSMRVSDTVLGAPSACTMVTDRIRCQKTASVECLVSKDRARRLIYFWVVTRDPRDENSSKMDSRGRKKDEKQSHCAIELQDPDIEPWGGSELQIFTEWRQNTSTECFGK